MRTRMECIAVDEADFRGTPVEIIRDFRILADSMLSHDETSSIELDVCVELETAHLLTDEPESFAFAARDETLMQVLCRLADLLEVDFEIGGSRIDLRLREVDDHPRPFGDEGPMNGVRGLPVDVLEAVLSHRLSADPMTRPFGVVANLEPDTCKVTPLADESLERVLWSSCADRERFIPPSRLLASGFGGESRQDSEGRVIEGMLDRQTSEGVFVLYVVGWTRLGETEWEVVTDWYLGPLAATGQSFRIRRTRHGFRIRRGKYAWLS